MLFIWTVLKFWLDKRSTFDVKVKTFPAFFHGICSFQLVSNLILPYFQKQLLRFFLGFLKSSMKVVPWRNFCMLICLGSIIIHLVRLCWTMPKQYKKVFLSSFVLFGMVNFELCSLQIWRLHITNFFMLSFTDLPSMSLGIDPPFSSFILFCRSALGSSVQGAMKSLSLEDYWYLRLLLNLLVMDAFLHDSWFMEIFFFYPVQADGLQILK